MDIILLSIGKISFKWIQQGIDEYEKRIKRYLPFTAKILPDIRKGSLSPSSQKEEEGKLILKELSGSDMVILLDERGQEFSSVEFAGKIDKIMLSGRKRLIFIIGGPYGFSENVYQRADFLIALSKMTFTHEMAKLILTEQLYRAMTILKGEPYHHI